MARDSIRYAEALTDRLFDAAGRLELFPLSGLVVPEVGREDIRELIVGAYHVVNRVSNDEVEILTVTHAAPAGRGRAAGRGVAMSAARDTAAA